MWQEDDCQLITTTGRRRLRSSNVATCDVPRTHTTLGDRSFTAAGPHLWNNLPLHLRDFELPLSEFRRLPKIAFVWLKIVAPSDLLLDVVRFTNVLTYLLTYLLGIQLPVHLVLPFCILHRHTK